MSFYYYYYSTHRETRTLASLFKMPARFRRSIKATSKHSSSRREKNKKIVAFQQSRPRVRRWKKREKRKRWKVKKRQKPFSPLAKTHFLSFFPSQSAREGRRGISKRKKEQGKRHTRVTYWRKRVVGTKRHPRPSAIENGTRRRGDVVRYVLLELGIELFKSTSGEVVEKREKGKGPDSIVIA